METSQVPPKPPRLTAEGENTLVSQVLEIIGGITLEALQTPDPPEERDAWSMEEGDDSVFYSDEDQPHQDVKGDSCCDAGAGPVPQTEGDKQENLEMEKPTTPLTEGEEECQELQSQNDELTHESESTHAEGAEADPSPEALVSARGGSLQPDCTNADVHTQAGPDVASDTVNLEVKAEKEAQSPNPESLHVTKEESSTRQSEEDHVLKETPDADLQTPGDRKMEERQKPEQDRSSRHPVGFHQGSSCRGYATLPAQMKHADQKSFDHLTLSKYGTVSYRKIRRGNTRQKVEEFEYMIMNL